MKQILLLSLCALGLTACKEEVSFQDIPVAACDVPLSSPRNGANKGAIIERPDAYQPFNRSLEVTGSCVNGKPVHLSGNGLGQASETACVGGRFRAVVAFKNGDGPMALEASQSTDLNKFATDRRCFTQDTVSPKVSITESNRLSLLNLNRAVVSGVCEKGIDVLITGPELASAVKARCEHGRFEAAISFSGPDGYKNVEAHQVDPAGNKGVDSKKYLTDLTAPVVKILSPATGTMNQGKMNLKGSCEAKVRLYVQDSKGQILGASPCENGEFDVALQLNGEDGPKALYAQQTDLAGNTGTTTSTYVKDTLAPVVMFTSTLNQSYVKGSKLLNGVCETGLLVKIEGAGIAAATSAMCTAGQFSANVQLTVGDGDKPVVGTQVDLAGNVGRQIITLKRDETAPLVTITAPTEKAPAMSSIQLTGACEEGLPVTIGGSGATATLTASCTGTYSAIVQLSSPDGVKSIEVKQVDLAGNIGLASRNFIRDSIAPVVTITSPSANSISKGSLVIAGTCETDLIVTLSGGIVATTSAPCKDAKFTANLELSINNGTKNIVAMQKDLAGNIGTTNRNFIRGNYNGYQTYTSSGPGGKVDILFVDDNSGSMRDEQASLGQKFPAFTQALKTTDWQAGVITTDCSPSSPYNFCGQLVNLAGRPNGEKILTTATPDYLKVFQNTIQREETLTCPKTGVCPTGNEEPLKSTIYAMTQRNSHNPGFFREKADLAVVILSDEDEQSTAPATATKPQQVVDTLKSIWNDTKRLSVHSIIIKPGDLTCYTQQRETNGATTYGTYAQQLSDLTGGLASSICASDYSLTLTEIGEKVTRLGRSIQLQNEPVPGSVKVIFTPAHATTWTVAGKVLTFAMPAPEGTKVEVLYEY